MAIVITRGSLTLAMEAWAGIDITDAQVNVSAGRWFMHESLDAATFLKSPMGKLMVTLPPEELATLQLAMQNVNMYMPAAEKAAVKFNSSQRHTEFDFKI